MDVLSTPAAHPLLMPFHPPRRLAEHLQCTCYLGSLSEIQSSGPTPYIFDSVNLRDPRNLHFNYLL